MSSDIVSHTEPMVNPAEAKAIAEANAQDAPVVAPVPPEVPVAPEPPPSPPDFTTVLEPFQQELATTGELKQESIDKLSEALGVPKDLVVYTYEGMKATRAQRDSAVLQTVGGAEAYQQMVAWANTSYGEEEALAFNQAIISGSKEDAIGAAQQLKQKFTEVNGSFQPRTQPAAAPSVPVARSSAASAIMGAPAVKPFASISELMVAQKDVRYGKDPTYTEDVYRRAAVSRI